MCIQKFLLICQMDIFMLVFYYTRLHVYDASLPHCSFLSIITLRIKLITGIFRMSEGLHYMSSGLFSSGY